MTWHADTGSLAAYAGGQLSDARSASIEAHATTCAVCRAALSDLADSTRLDGAWKAIEARVDEPATTLFERFLRRVGISEGTARLIVVTPSVRLPWIAAVSVVLALAVVATHAGPDDAAVFVFLVSAAVLPLAGIAMAFGRSDPAHELTIAAPVRKLDLLLARALTVLLITTALTAVATIALGREDWAMVTWLLPALGLTGGALALSTWVPTQWATGGLATVWVVGAVVSVRGSHLNTDLAERFVAFRPEGQLACVAVAVVGLAVLLLRRDALETGELA